MAVITYQSAAVQEMRAKVEELSASMKQQFDAQAEWQTQILNIVTEIIKVLESGDESEE